MKSTEKQHLQRSSLLEQAKYIEVLSNTMGKIHSKIPPADSNIDLSQPATKVDFREENVFGVNLKRAVIYLLTNGCEWALGKGNGCTVCGHIAKQTRFKNTIPAKMLIAQFEKAFSPLDFRQSPILNLYNNGSFFNDNEVPVEARRFMLAQIAKNKDIKMLILESRPEFISEHVLDELMGVCESQYVEVAIGLEVVDDLIRSVCLNKGYCLETFEAAVKTIVDAKWPNLGVRAYVMLKPPFLTEREGIEAAVETIQYAFKIGCSTVSLEPCTIQDYTLAHELYKMGEYRPPWLWSIVEVLERCGCLGNVVSSLFQFYPSSRVVPFNCERCSNTVLNAIKTYNRTRDISVLQGLDCSCKEKWKDELQIPQEPFSYRVESILKLVESRGC